MASEKRGLLFAVLATVFMIALMLVCTVPAKAILRDVKTGNILPNSPFMAGIFTWLVILFFVIAFAAAEFVALFGYTNLGPIMGINPATTQAAYRVADSSTNIITSLFAFAFIVLTSLNKYKKDAGLGTLISLMLPYSIVFLVSWSLVLVVFMLFDIPLGPGMTPLLAK